MKPRPTKELCATKIKYVTNPTKQHLLLNGRIYGKDVEIMIDSGAESNSITQKYLARLRLQEQQKKNKDTYQLFNYDLTAFNDNDGIVNRETKELTLQIQYHSKQIKLDIIKVPKDQIILGMPWLELHDPEIRFKTKTVKFSNCACMETRKQKKQHWSDIIQPISEKGMNAYIKRKKKSICRLERQSLREEGQDKILPEEFKEYELVFGTASDLPQPDHKPWDLQIDLQEGKQPTFGPIYQCSQRELEALDEYLQEAQQLVWI